MCLQVRRGGRERKRGREIERERLINASLEEIAAELTGKVVS